MFARTTYPHSCIQHEHDSGRYNYQSTVLRRPTIWKILECHLYVQIFPMIPFARPTHSPLSSTVTLISSRIEKEREQKKRDGERDTEEGKAMVEGRPPCAGYPAKLQQSLPVFCEARPFTR